MSPSRLDPAKVMVVPALSTDIGETDVTFGVLPSRVWKLASKVNDSPPTMTVPTRVESAWLALDVILPILHSMVV